MTVLSGVSPVSGVPLVSDSTPVSSVALDSVVALIFDVTWRLFFMLLPSNVSLGYNERDLQLSFIIFLPTFAVLVAAGRLIFR